MTDEDVEELRRCNELPLLKPDVGSERMMEKIGQGQLQLWRVYGPRFRALMVTEIDRARFHIYFLVGKGLRGNVRAMTEAVAALAREAGCKRASLCCGDPVRARMFSAHPAAVVLWTGTRYVIEMEV